MKNIISDKTSVKTIESEFEKIYIYCQRIKKQYLYKNSKRFTSLQS